MKLRFLQDTNLKAVQVLAFTPTPELEAEVLGLSEPVYSPDDEDFMEEHVLDMELNLTFGKDQTVEVEGLQKSGATTVNLLLPGDITAYDCDEARFEVIKE